jgi:MFS superfamily sulfate permease-like transporter
MFDLPAGFVVFLVALPLCLGIALASGAPLLAGVVAGVAGGLVVPLISRAPLSVSGPAAGLVAIVLTGIHEAGTFQAFALAVVIAGALQMLLGIFKAGFVAQFIPSSVIKGMLAAIGILLILKQLPHAIGYDKENMALTAFQVDEDQNTFSLFLHSLTEIEWGAAALSAACVPLLLLWEKTSLRKLHWLPGPLVVVVASTVAAALFTHYVPSMALEQKHLVTLPAVQDAKALFSSLDGPDWAAFLRAEIWMLGVTLAVIASLETLLNLEAIDQLDPLGRKSPPNTELVAQGTGNIVSGLLGGLPVTSVIVRSSANLNAGGRTRAAAFFHGVFLVVAVLFAQPLLNRIPLACLASILLVTGYKLAKPKVFIDMYKLGWNQFLPCMATVLAIVLTDLLRGLIIGMAVGLAFVLRSQTASVFDIEKEGPQLTIRFKKDACFLNRKSLLSTFEQIPENTHVVVDTRRAASVDHDITEAICRFRETARERNIRVEIRGLSPVAQE